MYLDHDRGNREGWKFTYTGSQLLEPAKKKYAEFFQKEKEARKEASKLNGDMEVDFNDESLSKAKKRVENCGPEKEKCAVWVHEFSRNPDRDYHLVLSDVVYFGLVE